MQLAIDIGVIALIALAIALLCAELGRSQKDAVPPARDAHPYMLHITLKAREGVKPILIVHSANNLQYLQQCLNNVSFHAIQHAVVYLNRRRAYTMAPNGVLVAV